MQDRALEAAEQRLLGSDVAAVLGMTWNGSKGESATFADPQRSSSSHTPACMVLTKRVAFNLS